MGVWENIVAAWKGSDHLCDAPGTSYNFDCMVELVKDPPKDLLLIDVREPAEFETVKIPGSFNVPYRSSPEAFGLPAAEFESKFGLAKPSQDTELVFFCAAGGRASNAQKKAISYGYNKTAIYPGSMNDWIANGGDKLKF